MFSKQGRCRTSKMQHALLHPDRQMDTKPRCPSSTSEDSMSHTCSLTQRAHELTNYQDQQKQAALPWIKRFLWIPLFLLSSVVWSHRSHMAPETLQWGGYTALCASHTPALFPGLNELNIYCGKGRAEAQEAFHFIWQQGWWAAGFRYKII